jgi:hypothetical protein
VDDSSVTIVVVRTHRFTWDEIETVEAGWMFGHMITLVPRDGWRTFSATFYGRPAAAQALRALSAPGRTTRRTRAVTAAHQPGRRSDA